jgi:putative transposase
MNTYKRHRFSPDIISYAVWLCYRFNLSHRDIEDLLAERGITVSREAIRLWCIKFGAIYTRRLARKHRGYGDVFYIDEVFVKINECPPPCGLFIAWRMTRVRWWDWFILDPRS